MIVRLEQLHLSLISDPSIGMAFPVQEAPRAAQLGIAAETYADGTVRKVVTPGKVQTATYTLGFITDEHVAFLEAHQGEDLCIRDPRGAKFYGYYAEAEFNPRRLPDSWSVTLACSSVTYSEAV